MKIRDLRRGGVPSRGGFACLARANFEPLPGVVVYDLSLERAPDGRLFLYSPMRNSAPVANFAPEVRTTLIAKIVDALEDDQNSNRVS